MRSPSRSRLITEDDASRSIDAPFEPSYADPEPVNDDVCIARPAKKDFSTPIVGVVKCRRRSSKLCSWSRSRRHLEKQYMESISCSKEEEEALWIEHFEGKLQSQDQLRKGFNLTRPIPMILDGELRIPRTPRKCTWSCSIDSARRI